jgi:hypothetical protein
MSSRAESPLDTTSQASAVPSRSTLPNAFGQIMQSQQSTRRSTPIVQRDRCQRPLVVYNYNYDLFSAPPVDLPQGYSPYVFGEPLFDDREVLLARLPARHTIAAPGKRPRTTWVWKLGYALTNHSKAGNPTFWACKLCMFLS